MKLTLLALSFLPLLVIAQTSPKPVGKNVAAKGFTITGKLTGIPDGTEVRLVKNGESEELIRGFVSKGSFSLKGSVKEPVLCFLYLGQAKPVEIYVENSNILITPVKDKPGQFNISGSSSHKDFKTFVDVFLPLVQQLSSLAGTINSMMPGAERDALMNSYNLTQQKIQNQIDSFVIKKPRSTVTPFVLNVTSQFYDDVIALENRFNKLDNKVKNSEQGQQLALHIADKKIGAIGTLALDFTQPDTTGQPITLSSFRGKFVLVDFWASWCGPCRVENPNVVQNYKRFRDKNFTVLGVSLDRPGQKEKWIQAINEDSLTWTHVSDLLFWSNAVAQLYRINAIPQNLLVDPQGKIIAKNLRGPDLEAKLCEVLGCN